MSIFNEGIKRNQGKALRKEDELNPLTVLKDAGKYIIKADLNIDSSVKTELENWLKTCEYKW